MATEGTYYLNGPDLVSSSAIFTDPDMNVCAPDGFYSNGQIVREQVNCILLPQQDCPTCAVPCGQIAGFSSNVNGTFLGQTSVGADLGAVIIYSIVGNSIPDGVLVTYDNQTFNQLTFQGNNGTPIGLNSTIGSPTYYGSANRTPTTTNNLPVYTIQSDGNYIQSSLPNRNIVVDSNNVDLRGGGGATVYTQVIPKATSVSIMNIDYFGPIVGTFFQYEASCPAALPSFQGAAIKGNTDCANIDTTYYFAPNATVTGAFPNQTFVPDTNTVPIVGNYVYSDANAGNGLNLTATPQYIILADNSYLEIVHGIVVAVGAQCTSPPLPCSGSLNPPVGNQGHYTVELDAGSTQNDVGAVMVYFDPQSFPDAIRVEYDGVYYNTLSTPSLGYRQSQSGIAGAFTLLGDPNNNCWAGQVGTNTYNRSILRPTNTWAANNPSTGNYTLNTTDNQTNAATQNVFSYIVIPKPNATPNIVTVEVLGPCPGTGFNLAIDCPIQLPSFQSSTVQSNNDCTASFSQVYYFAKDYADRADATVVYPKLYYFVFEDHDGITPLAQGIYIMDNNDFIQVDANGIVIATGACAPIP